MCVCVAWPPARLFFSFSFAYSCSPPSCTSVLFCVMGGTGWDGARAGLNMESWCATGQMHPRQDNTAVPNHLPYFFFLLCAFCFFAALFGGARRLSFFFFYWPARRAGCHLFFLMLRIKKKKIKEYRKIGNLPWRCCLCRYAGSNAPAARNDPMFARPSSCPSAPPCPRHFFLP